jgi:hypothetical protein
VKGSAALAAAFAALAVACVEDVELARLPDASLDGFSPDLTAPDVTPDVAPDVTPDTASDVTPDLSDVRRDLVEDSADASTLVVQAVLTAQSEDGMPREWQTEIDVTITRDGAPISGAMVTWNSPLGSIALPSVEGHHRGLRSGYPAWSELTVAAVGERPATQRWSTPEPHVITEPHPEESHAPLTPLDLVWAPTGAMEAQVIAPTMLTAGPDTGRATVPAMFFPREMRAVVVRVRRRTTTTLGGFAAGSSARNDVTASVQVLAP